MLYPYNAIFGRGLLNIFEATLHSAFLCLKVPATFSVITIFSSQKEARNIEHGFTPGRAQECAFLERRCRPTRATLSKQEILAEFNKAIEAEGNFTILALDPRVPDITCASKMR
jgi:hypothetical protein